MTTPAIAVHDVTRDYPRPRRRLLEPAPVVRALRGVSLEVAPGEKLGVVGESGSGKSTLLRIVAGLDRATSGTVAVDGRDVTRASDRELAWLRHRLQVVFQDPYSSLNPAMTVESILAEPLTAQGTKREDASGRIKDLLSQIDLDADAGSRYPREFSGGQRQRIAIARALALEPRLIVCDEPVSALDMSTQAHILDLLIDIQHRTGVAYLFISHDLSVIRYISHRVAVMLRGEIVEYGEGDVVTSNPEHTYTQRLLLASPMPDPVQQAERRRQYADLT